MKSLEVVQAQEREDWQKNAPFYKKEWQSPLAQLLGKARANFYGLPNMHGLKVLDLGCGVGLATRYLAADNQITAIDYAPSMLALYRELHPDSVARLVLADARRLPLPEESFDVVIADGVFHHLKVQGVLSETLSEIRRVLKKEGCLYVYDRNGSWVSNILLKTCLAIKKMCGWSGRISPATSATRNEVCYGGENDLRQIQEAGFFPEHRCYVSSFVLFISIVLCNVFDYAGGSSGCLSKLLAGLSRISERVLKARCVTVEQCLTFQKKGF